jgi:hypothetical protein
MSPRRLPETIRRGRFISSIRTFQIDATEGFGEAGRVAREIGPNCLGGQGDRDDGDPSDRNML